MRRKIESDHFVFVHYDNGSFLLIQQQSGLKRMCRKVRWKYNQLCNNNNIENNLCERPQRTDLGVQVHSISNIQFVSTLSLQNLFVNAISEISLFLRLFSQTQLEIESHYKLFLFLKQGKLCKIFHRTPACTWHHKGDRKLIGCR